MFNYKLCHRLQSAREEQKKMRSHLAKELGADAVTLERMAPIHDAFGQQDLDSDPYRCFKKYLYLFILIY